MSKKKRQNRIRDLPPAPQRSRIIVPGGGGGNGGTPIIGGNAQPQQVGSIGPQEMQMVEVPGVQMPLVPDCLFWYAFARYMFEHIDIVENSNMEAGAKEALLRLLPQMVLGWEQKFADSGIAPITYETFVIEAEGVARAEGVCGTSADRTAQKAQSHREEGDDEIQAAEAEDSGGESEEEGRESEEESG